jgi:hypothetical protein
MHGIAAHALAPAHQCPMPLCSLFNAESLMQTFSIINCILSLHDRCKCKVGVAEWLEIPSYHCRCARLPLVVSDAQTVELFHGCCRLCLLLLLFCPSAACCSACCCSACSG